MVCANFVDWQIPKYGMFHILDPEVVVMFKKKERCWLYPLFSMDQNVAPNRGERGKGKRVLPMYGSIIFEWEKGKCS